MQGGESIKEFPADVVDAAEVWLKGDDLKKGQSIWAAYDACAKGINNSLNRMWRPLKSGENETQLLQAMLKKLWPERARDKCYSALSSKKNRVFKKKQRDAASLTAEEEDFLGNAFL